MNPPEAVEVHISAPDAALAETIARALVADRLAACVQIVPDLTSIYRWEGAVETATEVLLLAKSSTRHTDRLFDRVRDLHPYAVPEILAIPVVAIDPPYAAWLAAELA